MLPKRPHEKIFVALEGLGDPDMEALRDLARAARVWLGDNAKPPTTRPAELLSAWLEILDRECATLEALRMKERLRA